MGLMLDSSIVIGAERRNETPERLIEQLTNRIPDQPLSVSAIALTEIVHAVFRAPDSERRLRRETFIRSLLMDIEVVPYTRATAFLAGKIDGEQRALGVTIPSMDLLIGATALEIGYSVVTVNLRHFQLIPGLKVIALSGLAARFCLLVRKSMQDVSPNQEPHGTQEKIRQTSALSHLQRTRHLRRRRLPLLQ